MIAGGLQSSFGVFFKPMSTELGWSRALTAGAFTLNLVMQAVMSIVIGRLNDRFGPRILVTAAGVLLGTGYILLSQIDSIWQIYLFYGILVGAGSSTWVPILSTQMRWFVKYRGLICGLVSSGISVGMVVGPPLATKIIEMSDWRNSYFTIGLIALLLSVTAAQFLKRDPSQISETAYGTKTSNANGAEPVQTGLSLKEAVRTSNFWIFGIAFFSLNFCLQTMVVHIVPHATDIGIEATVAATILSVLGIVSIAGRLSVGFIADRLGCKVVMVTVNVLMVVSFILLLTTNGLGMIYLFAVIFAISYGGFSTIQSPIVADSFGLKSHGTILGLILVGNFVGGGLGPFIAGRIFDTSGSYYSVFTICAVLSFIVVLISLRLKSSVSAK